MSAFLQSGRFYHCETPIFRVRFRPKAVIAGLTPPSTLSMQNQTRYVAFYGRNLGVRLTRQKKPPTTTGAFCLSPSTGLESAVAIYPVVRGQTSTTGHPAIMTRRPY